MVMGLDISPGGARWSYSGFGRFRERLAEAEGITLQDMAGFGGTAEEGRQKPWDNVNSPLVPLLNHSDCDGYLDSYECAEVVDRLAEIVAEWPENDYDRRSAEALISGMRHCAEHGCSMAFH